MGINTYVRWLSRVTLAVAIINDRMGCERNPHPTGHRMVCDIEYDLDGAVADICDLAAAWLLPGYCGVGAG